MHIPQLPAHTPSPFPTYFSSKHLTVVEAIVDFMAAFLALDCELHKVRALSCLAHDECSVSTEVPPGLGGTGAALGSSPTSVS